MSPARSPRCFLDSNVLLYMVDAKEPRKAAQARTWMTWLKTHYEIQVSWQVLHEFYHNAIRKLELPPELARRIVLHYQRLDPVDSTAAIVARAWHWQDEAQLNYWDALILAAAEQSGCTLLLSEDFSDGRNFGSVVVKNPFRHDPG